MKQTSTPGDNELSRWKWPLIIGAPITLVLEAIYAIVVIRAFGRPESAGIFGDMFGALNTLFAGLAFAGVVFTVYLQVTDSVAARHEQAASLKKVEEQITVLQQDLDLQRKRYRVEAGPFFKLDSASRSAGSLNLTLVNEGAPVLVHDFGSVAPGCSVQPWWPSSLPHGETFHAPTSIPPNATGCAYRMKLRDRWGDMRVFELRLDFNASGTRLDFTEV